MLIFEHQWLALSLELMGIKDWFSSFVMLCRPLLQLNPVVVCLWVFLSLVLSSARGNACKIGLRSGDWLGRCRIFHFSTFKNVCFRCMFWVIVRLYREAPPNQLCSIWLNLGRHYILTHSRNHPAASVTSSINTSKPVLMETMHAHAITLLHHVSQMMQYAFD